MNQKGLSENERRQSIDANTKMAKMLELSQILKQFKKKNTSMSNEKYAWNKWKKIEHLKKIESISKEMEGKEKNQVEVLVLKHKISSIKRLMHGCKSRMEETDEIINESW